MDGRLVIGIKPLTIISMEKLDLEEFESIKKDFHKYEGTEKVPFIFA